MLAESGAILWYLAEGTDYLPGNRIGRAQVLRWICFEQNAHETSLAEARFILSHPELSQGRYGDILAEKQKRGYAALALMEQHLGADDFFAAGRYTIADMALYGYTQVAGDGGFDLSQYPAIGAWLAAGRRPAWLRPGAGGLNALAKPEAPGHNRGFMRGITGLTTRCSIKS